MKSCLILWCGFFWVGGLLPAAAASKQTKKVSFAQVPVSGRERADDNRDLLVKKLKERERWREDAQKRVDAIYAFFWIDTVCPGSRLAFSLRDLDSATFILNATIACVNAGRREIELHDREQKGRVK